MEPEQHFPSAADLVRRHKKIIITVFLVVFVCATLVTLMLPPKYSSSMKILIRSSPKDLVSAPDRADTGTTSEVSEEDVNSEVELLTGYDVLRSAVVQNHLQHSSWLHHGNEESEIDAAVRKLSKSLQVTPVRKADIIQVDYEAKSPRLAAGVLRSIQAAYVEAHLKSQSTPGGYTFFRQQADYYGKQLTQNEQDLATFRRQQGVANLPEQRTLLMQSLVERQTALQASGALIAQLHQEIEQSRSLEGEVPSRLATASRSGPNQFSVDHLSSLLADLQNRRTLLLSKFRDDDPFVAEVNQEIAQTQASLDAAKQASVLEQGTDINPALQTLQIARHTKQVELRGEQARYAALSQQVQSLTDRLNRLDDMAGRYDVLITAVQQAQDNFASFSKRREVARVSEQLDRSKITNVVVSQPPTESQLPLPSRGLIGIVLGLLLAAMASVTAAVASEVFGYRQEQVSYS